MLSIGNVTRWTRPGRFVTAVLAVLALLLSMETGGRKTAFAAAASVQVSPSTLAPQSSATISGDGLPRWAWVTLALDGSTSGMPTSMTRSDGSFSVRWSVPQTIAAGTHTISASANGARATTTIRISTAVAAAPSPTSASAAAPTPAATATPTALPPTPTATRTPTATVAASPSPVPSASASASPSSSASAPSTVRLLAGRSSAYTDAAGNTWAADTYYSGGTVTSFGGISVANASDSTLFQAERWGLSGYSIPVANGTYTVRLYFAENYTGITAAGQRVFGVTVEGTSLGNIDVFAETGGRNRALVKSTTVSVGNGQLDVAFTPSVQNPMIDALEVVPSSGNPAPTSTPVPSASCGQTLQSLVDAAAAGSTLNVPACLFRETVTISKRLTIVGQPGSEIRGSDLWTSWQQSGSAWVSTQAVPNLPFGANPYNSVVTDPRAGWPEQVFVDGVEQDQIDGSGTPQPGQFKLADRGSDRRVVLGTNPAGHSVEVTTRAAWMVVKASDITVRGMTMKHAGSNYQHGGLDVYGQDRFVLESSDLSYAHAANVAVYYGVDHRLSGNHIHHGGNVGIDAGADFYGAPVSGFTVEDNELDHNNTQGFNPGWHAGALKATVRSNAIFRRNDVHDNTGPGLWMDTRANGAQFYENRIHHNDGPGIFFEVSDGASIHDNVLWENSRGSGDNWGWQAAILVSTSRNVEVANNLVAWSGDGVSVIWQPMRGDAPAGGATGNYVHDNTIVQLAGQDRFGLAWLQDRSDGSLYSDSSNRGERNLYWFDQAESGTPRFSWTSNGSTFAHLARLADFNAARGEEGGRYLSNAEKDQVLSAKSVPTAAQAR